MEVRHSLLYYELLLSVIHVTIVTQSTSGISFAEHQYYCAKLHSYNVKQVLFTVINLILIKYKSSTYTTLHIFQYSAPARSISMQNHISWKAVQISAAVASQLCLSLSNVLKLQGLTKHECSVE